MSVLDISTPKRMAHALDCCALTQATLQRWLELAQLHKTGVKPVAEVVCTGEHESGAPVYLVGVEVGVVSLDRDCAGDFVDLLNLGRKLARDQGEC